MCLSVVVRCVAIEVSGDGLCECVAKTDRKLKYVLWLESDSQSIGDRLNVRSFSSDIIISVEAILKLMAKHNSKEVAEEEKE